MSSSPVRIGIIGYGGFGQFLRRSWSSLGDVVVSAVADNNRDLDPGDISYYSSWKELIRDPSVDLVSIVTPPSTHAEIACAAMEAGKHVVIEKPVATTLRDAERIVRTQRSTGRIAAVDYLLRFNPIVETIHSWCRDKPFGELRRVLVENYAQDDALSPEHWFWDMEQSGGILVEHSVHFIDIVSGCTAARVKRISGCAVKRNERQIDRMGFTARYEDGLVVSQYHAFSRPGFFEETTMRFVFDLAEVHVEGWIPLRGTFSAIASRASEPALMRFPGAEVSNRQDIGQADDSSRPEGWGGYAPGDERRSVRSGGVTYEASEVLKGRFTMPVPKSEAYASALRSLILDVVRGIRLPDHRLRVTLEDGISSLEIAIEATKDALR